MPQPLDIATDLERIVEIELPPDDAEIKTTTRGKVIAVRVPDPRRRFRTQMLQVIGEVQPDTGEPLDSPRAGQNSLRNLARRDRRYVVHALYRKGLSYSQIAAAVGCSPNTAREDVNALLDQWAEERKHSEERYRAGVAVELDWVKNEARAAWLKSKEDEVLTRTKTKQFERTGKDGTSAPSQKTNEGQVQKRQRVGDPRFLERFAWAVEAEVKLYGLNAPEEKKVEIRASAELLKEMMEAAGSPLPPDAASPQDSRTIEMQRWLDSPEGKPTTYLPVMQSATNGNGAASPVMFDPKRHGGNGEGHEE